MPEINNVHEALTSQYRSDVEKLNSKYVVGRIGQFQKVFFILLSRLSRSKKQFSTVKDVKSYFLQNNLLVRLKIFISLRIAIFLETYSRLSQGIH